MSALTENTTAVPSIGVILLIMVLLYVTREPAKALIRSLSVFISSTLTSIRGFTHQRARAAYFRYEDLQHLYLLEQDTEQSERTCSAVDCENADMPDQASIFVPCVLSAFIVAAAVIGIFANAQLLYFPLMELIGDGEALPGIKSALMGALAIIMVEIAAGAIACEAFGVTNWGLLDANARGMKVVGGAALVCLIALAGAEAVLVHSRESIVANQYMLEQALTAASEPSASDASQTELATYGQIAIAFVLPLVLALAMIPLRSFLRTGRICAQLFWSGALGAVASVAATGRRWVRAGEGVVQACFDLLIAMPAAVASGVALVFRYIEAIRLKRAFDGGAA